MQASINYHPRQGRFPLQALAASIALAAALFSGKVQGGEPTDGQVPVSTQKAKPGITAEEVRAMMDENPKLKPLDLYKQHKDKYDDSLKAALIEAGRNKLSEFLLTPNLNERERTGLAKSLAALNATDVVKILDAYIDARNGFEFDKSLRDGLPSLPQFFRDTLVSSFSGSIDAQKNKPASVEWEGFGSKQLPTMEERLGFVAHVSDGKPIGANNACTMDGIAATFGILYGVPFNEWEVSSYLDSYPKHKEDYGFCLNMVKGLGFRIERERLNGRNTEELTQWMKEKITAGSKILLTVHTGGDKEGHTLAFLHFEDDSFYYSNNDKLLDTPGCSASYISEDVHALNVIMPPTLSPGYRPVTHYRLEEKDIDELLKAIKKEKTGNVSAEGDNIVFNITPAMLVCGEDSSNNVRDKMDFWRKLFSSPEVLYVFDGDTVVRVNEKGEFALTRYGSRPEEKILSESELVRLIYSNKKEGDVVAVRVGERDLVVRTE